MRSEVVVFKKEKFLCAIDTVSVVAKKDFPDKRILSFRMSAKSNFRKGGANLRVCPESPQRFPTFSEITFRRQHLIFNLRCAQFDVHLCPQNFPMKKILCTFCAAFFVLTTFAADDFTRTEDVVYGHKAGMALTLDIFQPKNPNGFGIVYMVSGGWFSAHEAISPPMYQSFLKNGYTVFAVCHGSQPKFQIPEIVKDVNRAVRFIRHNAKKYGVDPNHLGVSGGSAGGHLSLTLGTSGGPGQADAKDPIDRESSAVQCVACFFPPTDFLNYGKPGESALGENILKDYKPAFGQIPTNGPEKEKFGREISPIYHVTSNTPPTLILHGDKDFLVPIQQAESFIKKAKESGVTAKLVVKEGGAHGWKDWIDDFALFVSWFDEHLRGVKKN